MIMAKLNSLIDQKKKEVIMKRIKDGLPPLCAALKPEPEPPMKEVKKRKKRKRKKQAARRKPVWIIGGKRRTNLAMPISPLMRREIEEADEDFLTLGTKPAPEPDKKTKKKP